MKIQKPKFFLKIFLTISFAGFFSVQNVWSAPSITGISGTVSNGQNLIISGSQFGNSATVMFWDNFESQTPDVHIKGAHPLEGPTYGTILVNGGSDNGLTFSNLEAYSGSKAAKVDWQAAGDRAIGFGSYVNNFDKVYISYWRYMNYTGALPAATNHKQWYLFGNKAGSTPQGVSFIPQANQTWGISNNNGSIPKTGTWSYQNGIGAKIWSGTINTWNRWEYWITLNTNPTCVMGSTCDGKRYEWIDSQLNFSDDKYYWQNNGGLYNAFFLGYMHGSSDGIPDAGQAYFDDLYVASSPARLELCDSSTWSTRSHCEVQLSTSWAGDGTSIGFTLNQGAFNYGDNAYLYVIDENGNPSEGYPITFASSSDTTAPATPSGLSVQ